MKFRFCRRILDIFGQELLNDWKADWKWLSKMKELSEEEVRVTQWTRVWVWPCSKKKKKKQNANETKLTISVKRREIYERASFYAANNEVKRHLLLVFPEGSHRFCYILH